MTESRDVIADLVAEGEELDDLLGSLDESGWATPTPSPGWTVKHQVAHLAATFKLATLAASDADRFTAMTSKLSPDFNANVDAAMAPYMPLSSDDLLAKWRADFFSSAKVLASVPPGQLVPWLVRPLTPAVLASAGMMELFGHGQDIFDGLGKARLRQDPNRLWWLVTFAVRTWDFGYQARGLTTPQIEFRFEIAAPSGETWVYGPDDASNRITGVAEDFCLLVTRRRHRADLAVDASGPEAIRWLDLAQAYRGPAGDGRRPKQFATA